MEGLLNSQIRITRVSNAVAAGATDSNGTGVDMQADGGYDGVLFVALLGALTATQVTALHGQQSDDDGSTDAYSDLEGSNVGPLGDDDDNDCLVLDVYHPTKRYVRPVVDRATANAVIDGVIAIQYKGRTPPTSHDATVFASTAVVSPAEGTP